MDSKQAFELEQAQSRLKISDAELMQLARQIAHNAGMQSLAELSWFESRELIGVLDIFERGEAGRSFRRRESELIGA